MANLTIGTKAIIRAERGNTANGFKVGETVLITFNEIDGSREQGRIAFSKLDGQGIGYADPENLIPVNEEEDGVVKVQLEGASFEGTVKDVLAVIKGLQELTEVKPATTAQFEKVTITPAKPTLEEVIAKAPNPTLNGVGVGDKIVITHNRKHGDMNHHGFRIGDVVEVFNVMSDRVGAENEFDTWYVHQDDFKKHVELTPEVGMLAIIKAGKGETGCLYGFEDGELVTITAIDKTEYKPIHVRQHGTEHKGYADLNDIELLF